MIYCLGGGGTVTIAGEQHILAPGTLFLIAPSRPHGLTPGTAKKSGTMKPR